MPRLCNFYTVTLLKILLVQIHDLFQESIVKDLLTAHIMVLMYHFTWKLERDGIKPEKEEKFENVCLSVSGQKKTVHFYFVNGYTF